MTTFNDLGLIAPLMQALTEENYTTPTPIQAQSIPHLLAGRDLLGLAQTGTGKTAAFTLPTLQRLMEKKARPAAKSTRVLILCPTRELAVQIQESIRTYGRHLPVRSTMIFGGVTQFSQVRAMQRGVDLLVATPGRLRDLINQGHVDLKGVEVLILDEADRMLDMGFLPEIRKLVALVPKERQTLLFSATMPREITDLAYSLLNNPERVEVAPVSSTAERVEQRLYHVAKNNKRALLAHVLRTNQVDRALIFARTKHGADRIAQNLEKDGFETAVIHGNKSQNARQRAIGDLKSGRLNLLIATDIAARGIDIDGVTHVINVDLPNEPESYVHRIGRTARAGASGIALSFCDAEERAFLRDIEKITRQQIPVVEDHPYTGDLPPLNVIGPKPKRGGGGRSEGRQDRAPRPGQAQRKRQTSREDRAAVAAELDHSDIRREPRRDNSRSDEPRRDNRQERRDSGNRHGGDRANRHLSQPAAMIRELEAREERRSHGQSRDGQRDGQSRDGRRQETRGTESRHGEGRNREDRHHHHAGKGGKPGNRNHRQDGQQRGPRNAGANKPKQQGGGQRLKRNEGNHAR
ncbi:DEAD/DEAH box helicase [Dongia soli]|uniref:DEAD/DEAH box helicase n=1 Tax=Dongia soli TaxID=600628 RepID=A0ABU5EAU5_9PROT|nr:DEAD/DEAH box helicase [Dongia soli]MDY0883471.1 DEAD/DEAH box helicase [Dongia soli]